MMKINHRMFQLKFNWKMFNYFILMKVIRFFYFVFKKMNFFLKLKGENWIEIRLKQDSYSHLIKPTTLTLDVFKSILIDNPQIPM